MTKIARKLNHNSVATRLEQIYRDRGPVARQGPDNGRVHRDNRRRDVCATRGIAEPWHIKTAELRSAPAAD